MVPMIISAGAATSVGQVRSVNEDAWCIAPGVFAVADGMGGHMSGDRASQLAVAALAELGDRGAVDTEQLQAALTRANNEMVLESSASPAERAMGTTVCGVAEVSLAGTRHWAVFNIGDSRVYQVTGSTLEQLTVDHSEVQELLGTGQITPLEARVHPLRNVVTRSLGSAPAPTADVWLVPMEPGQTFVLCSDGLTLELDDTQIADVVQSLETPSDIAHRLVDLAHAAGGRDNVTVVVVRTAPSTEESASELTTLLRRPLIEESSSPRTDHG